jgi:hypothetical protein
MVLREVRLRNGTRAPCRILGMASHRLMTFGSIVAAILSYRALSPCTPQERSRMAEEVVACDLRIVVHGANGFRLERVIRSLRVGSWGARGRTFSSGEVWVLPSGEYEMSVEGHDIPPALFRDRGAAIYLDRMEPVGPDMGIQMSTSVGFVLLAVAVILIVACALSPRRLIRRHSPRETSSD